MPKKKRLKFSLKNTKIYLLAAFFVLIIAGAAAAFGRLGEQVSVNRIATDEMSPEMIARKMPAPPEGCYYQQARCSAFSRERCDAIPTLVCPAPSPGATCRPRPACLDSAIKCKIADIPGLWCESPGDTCIPDPCPKGEVNGCVRPDLPPNKVFCRTPQASCVPIPECPEGRMCKQSLPVLAPGQQYCERPVPSCVPDPCLAANVVDCKRPALPANRSYCTTPKPTCVPLPTCPEGRMCAQYVKELLPGQEYCTPPRPTCVPRPACLEQGCKIGLPSNVNWCPPPTKPSPTSQACRAKIKSITLSDKCETGFRTAAYQCDTDSPATINSQTCMTVLEIQAKIRQDCGTTCQAAKPD